MKPQLQLLQKKHNLGYYGETLATSYLETHGYTIIIRNFKARYGEIDIIAKKDGILVFVEVKTRIGEKFGKPEEAVSPRKLHEVVITSAYYAMLHDLSNASMRVDLIAIALYEDRTVKYLKHLENITS